MTHLSSNTLPADTFDYKENLSNSVQIVNDLTVAPITIQNQIYEEKRRVVIILLR